MEYKEHCWLTNSQMVKNQSMLCENLCTLLEVVKTLNPAMLLPVDSGPPEHDSLNIMDEVFSILPDFHDQYISHLDAEYFRDGSSFFWKAHFFVGYTV
jgi:hypothetical protein